MKKLGKAAKRLIGILCNEVRRMVDGATKFCLCNQN